MAEYVRCEEAEEGSCELPAQKQITEEGKKVKVRRFAKRDCKGVPTKPGEKPKCQCFILASRKKKVEDKEVVEELFYKELYKDTEDQLKGDKPKYAITAACLEVNKLGAPRRKPGS